MKKGLVLEGGGMRGIFSAGVMDVLMENDIEFDGGIGVSAGALFGCNYKSKQPGRVIRYNVKYCRNRHYVSYFNLLTTGDIFGVDFCYRKLPFELDIWDHDTFEKNPMEFYVVCTDVITGEPYYHKCTDGMYEDIKYMRASGSMPLVSKVVSIGDWQFLDGSAADSIPLAYFQSIGYEKNLVILTRPKGYVKKKTPALPLMKLKYQKNYPGIVRAMERRHIMYNETLEYIEEQESEGNTFVIRPPRELRISRTASDPEELKRIYRMGRHTAKKYLNRIKEFMTDV